MANLCTDAGHGGRDSGASWQGILEKDLNLAYTTQLNEVLKSRGHKLLTTRKSDVNVPPLGTRCQLVNTHHQQKVPAFDAIVSIHCNVAAVPDEESGGFRALESRRGFYAIYSQESAASTALARQLADAVGKAGIRHSHGGLLSTIELGRTLAWIHKTIPPSVLLELGFMTNPDELQLLQTSEYRSKMVNAIADGVEAYLKS